MENKIRKAIREQIKKLHEGLGTSALQVTMENGVIAIIEDPKDIEAYDRGNTVIGTDADGKEHELNIDWSLDSHMTANEGMSPEEWVNAKEAERLANHPEKDKINKIKKMMDKEKQDKIDTIKQIHPKTDTDPLKKLAGLKEKAAELGYLEEGTSQYQKVTFIYTEQGGHFYGLDVYVSKDQDQRSDKLKYDEANEWLKDTLAYIHEDDLIPRKYISGLEDLNLIVDRLKELGIEASHGDYMDVS